MIPSTANSPSSQHHSHPHLIFKTSRIHHQDHCHYWVLFKVTASSSTLPLQNVHLQDLITVHTLQPIIQTLETNSIDPSCLRPVRTFSTSSRPVHLAFILLQKSHCSWFNFIPLTSCSNFPSHNINFLHLHHIKSYSSRVGPQVSCETVFKTRVQEQNWGSKTDCLSYYKSTMTSNSHAHAG